MMLRMVCWVQLSPSTSPTFSRSRMTTIRLEQRMISSSSELMKITDTPSPHISSISR